MLRANQSTTRSLSCTEVGGTGHSVEHAIADDTGFQKLKINNQVTRLLTIIVTQYKNTFTNKTRTKNSKILGEV
jgi:hypothetical protein